MPLGPPPPIHGDDHCPGGPDPIPCLRCSEWVSSFQNSEQSIGAQTVTDVVFDDAEVSVIPQTALGFDVDFYPTIAEVGLYAWIYEANFSGNGSSDWVTLQTIFFGDVIYLPFGTTETYDVASLSATAGPYVKAQHGWLIVSGAFNDPFITVKPRLTCDDAEDLTVVFSIMRINCVLPGDTAT